MSNIPDSSFILLFFSNQNSERQWKPAS